MWREREVWVERQAVRSGPCWITDGNGSSKEKCQTSQSDAAQDIRDEYRCERYSCVALANTESHRIWWSCPVIKCRGNSSEPWKNPWRTSMDKGRADIEHAVGADRRRARWGQRYENLSHGGAVVLLVGLPQFWEAATWECTHSQSLCWQLGSSPEPAGPAPRWPGGLWLFHHKKDLATVTYAQVISPAWFL